MGEENVRSSVMKRQDYGEGDVALCQVQNGAARDGKMSVMVMEMEIGREREK